MAHRKDFDGWATNGTRDFSRPEVLSCFTDSRLEGFEKANCVADTDLSVRFDKMDLLKVLNKAEDFWARTSSGLQRKVVVGLGVVSWTW